MREKGTSSCSAPTNSCECSECVRSSNLMISAMPGASRRTIRRAANPCRARLHWQADAPGTRGCLPQKRARQRSGGTMIRLRLDVADVQRMRFAYPPITEIAEILYRLHDTITAHPLLGSWPAGTRRVLHPPDVDLLRALVPARGNTANFLGPGAADTSMTVDDQLR